MALDTAPSLRHQIDAGMYADPDDRGIGDVHKSKAWQSIRLTIIARDQWQCGMCRCLLTEGKKDPRAAVVDHIIPAAMRPDLFYAPDNLWAVCKACHDGPCASIEARHRGYEAIRAAKMDRRGKRSTPRAVGLDGYPIR